MQTSPKNIITSLPKTGHWDSTIGHLFNKPLPHIKDEYDRVKELHKVLRNIIKI